MVFVIAHGSNVNVSLPVNTPSCVGANVIKKSLLPAVNLSPLMIDAEKGPVTSIFKIVASPEMPSALALIMMLSFSTDCASQPMSELN